MILNDDDNKNVDDDDNALRLLCGAVDIENDETVVQKDCFSDYTLYILYIYHSRQPSLSSCAASVYHVSLCFIILNGITIFDVILDFFFIFLNYGLYRMRGEEDMA